MSEITEGAVMAFETEVHDDSDGFVGGRAGAHGWTQHLTWELALVLAASTVLWTVVAWLVIRTVSSL